MKYILFAGENMGWYQRRLLLKCAKKIRNNPPAKADVAKPVPSLKSGKRGPVICELIISLRVNNFGPTHPPSGSKNVILYFLENIIYIWDGI